MYKGHKLHNYLEYHLPPFSLKV